jgi:PST family polysaccharide transporter/lipopolysaccharide exporter
VKLSDHLDKGIWGAADRGLPVLYGIGYVLLVIRVLPEIELGNFALVQTIFLIISGLANGFALQPLLKFASEERSDRRELIGTALILNAAFVLLCSIVLVLFRMQFAALLNAPELTRLLPLVPAMLFGSFIRNFVLVLLQTRYRVRQVFWTDAVHFIGAITLVYVWSKLHLFDSAYDLVYINLISLSASSIVGVFFCRNIFDAAWKLSRGHVKEFWGYGRYVFASIVSYLFYSNSDYFFLAAFSGPAQVGIYSAVKTFARIFDTMQQLMQMFILPASSRLSSVGDFRSLKVLTEKAICFGTLALTPIFLLFVFFADPLMSAISDGRFVGAAPLLQLFGLLSLITAANAVAGNVLFGLGKAKEGFILSILLLISSAAFYAICVPIWGALGATIGYLLSSALLTWLTVHKVQQFVPFTLRGVLARVGDATQFVKIRLGRA